MNRQGFLPDRIEGVRSPALACDETLRLCKTERHAFLASVTISKLTYEEIGNRLGVTKQAVNKWKASGVPHNRVRAFCNATGTRLLEQFLVWERAKRNAFNQMREADEVAQIVAQAAAA